ncbi:NAD-dependent epimerase/dehydratase family protein [Legionella maceachernii]|uniref:NAD dependent epimerase/dehydratase family protein n=1 Tax=Legionella maceachernii TaxID=466 RepID=A0A0W0VVR7_9GAMM|nr:NAD-dependent epimerase/dehydratase family protein [Legionella maceachernii]KTD24147.1 NAD dependent epimerase/dehydratase family protein [Legionella maceachernii]SJZ87353.1 Nucleoside-diphosphate-sugar epimerase [Legionella maceachernii]SUO98944.1 CDP-paratose 2-epimerase [Legionella maceachernii]
MSYNILVTGGAGYLGSTLVPDLLHAGHKVTVLDNFMFKQASLNHACHNPNFTVVKGDIRVESTITPLIKKADIIIPLAALVGAPLCNFDPVGASTINHDAIIMMLRLLSKKQIVLMPTTNSAYGTGDEKNFCTEESPLRPISLYAKEKVKVEQELMQRENAISYRLATVFGMSPRMRTDLLVNDFTYRAVHDKFVVLFESAFKRNYIHVRDVSRAFQHGITNFDKMKGQIYNVGLSDTNISKRELCERIQKQVPDFVFIDAPVGKDPDQRNYVVSNAKIEKTGFKTTVSLDQGIAELIKGYTMMKNTQYSNV